MIKDLKIFVNGIPYIVSFIVIQSNVLGSSYYMLLGRPWLRHAKVFHDWGNDIITIQGTGIVKTIHVTKNLETPTKQPKVFVCYDFHLRIYDEEDDLMFAIEPRLFAIEIIVVPTLVKLKQPISWISSTSLNLIEHVFVPIEPVSILPIM